MKDLEFKGIEDPKIELNFKILKDEGDRIDNNLDEIESDIEEIQSNYLKKTHDPTYFEDLSLPSNIININGLSAPPGVDANTGLLLFDSASPEIIGVLLPMSRSKLLDSSLVPYVQWKKTTGAAGGVTWQMRYRWFNVGEDWGAWSSIVTSNDDPGTNQNHVVSLFDEASPPANEAVSSIFLVQVGRAATDAGDTYGADALLYNFGVRYKKSRIGTE